jgi:hypothetical protein
MYPQCGGVTRKPCARHAGDRLSPHGGCADESEHYLQTFSSAEESEESPMMNQTSGEKGMRRLQAFFIVGLCAIFLVGQWGCGTHSVEVRAPFGTGTIGGVSAQYTPAF